MAEQREGVVQTVAFELLTRARVLADRRETSVTAVVLGPAMKDGLQELIQRGADRVLTVDALELAVFLPEPYTRALVELIGRHRPETILAGATSQGRTLLPLVAVKCEAGLTADCTELDVDPETGDLLQTRPAIGGNIMATIKTPEHRPQMATVRPKSTKPAPPDPARTGTIVRETLPGETLRSRVRRTGFRRTEEGGANLQEAEVIVSGGRGMKRKEHFAMLRELADLLEGALGASRDAVDRGWIGYPHQVGLSGKTVSPKLYLCAGISGSVQHLAGMKTADCIIAINSNPDAPIFQVANYGIVGDLFEVVPLLIERLKARRAPEVESPRK